MVEVFSLYYSNLLQNECFDTERMGQRQAFDIEELFLSVANNTVLGQ